MLHSTNRSSMFGQKPAFGGFGSQPNHSIAFGSASQQTQSNFGSTVFGVSTPFGASSQPAFAAAPALVATSTAAFGVTSTPVVCSSFTSTFGSTGTAFGVSSAPAFRSGGGLLAPSTLASSPSGVLSTLPIYGSTGFGQSAFGGQCEGSRVATYTATAEVDGSRGRQCAGKLQSISAMPVHKDKSHESLRWEDYQLGNKGGRGSVGQSTNEICFNSSSKQSNPFFPSTTSGHPSVNPCTSNPFLPKATTSSSFVSSPSIFSSTPGLTSSNPFFPSTTSGHPSVNPCTSSATSNPFLPNATTSSSFVSSPSIFSSTPGLTSSNPIFPSTTSGLTSVNPCTSSFTPNLFLPKATTSSSFVSSPSFFSSTPGLTSSNPFFPSTTSGHPSVNPCTSSATSNPFLPKATTSSSFVSSPSIFSSNPGLTSSNPFFPSTTSGHPSVNTCTSSATSNPFLPKAPTSGSFVSSPSIFSSTPGLTSSNPFFPSTTSGHPFVNTTCTSSATSNPFFCKAPTSSSFVSSPSIFSSTSGLTSGLSLFSTQSSQVFQTASSLEQTNSSCGQSSFSFGPGNAPSLSQPNMCSALSTGNVFSSTTSLLSTTNPTASIQTTPSSTLQPSQTTQWSPQPLPVTSPFGIPHAVPRMSTDFPGPSIQYGISGMPVKDRSAPTRSSSLLTCKNLSRRKITVVQKYHPKSDGPKIPFYSVDEGKYSMPKANSMFIPRENPRAWVISPTEKCSEKTSPLVHENRENYTEKGSVGSVKQNVKLEWVHDDDSIQKGASHITVTGHKAGEAATTHEHGVDITALMPKLQSHEYYTEPQIQELALKERDEPGFCSCVNDFVIGRHGYGSIKFLGETDVQQLDINSLVQFNNREVIVYMDESKKPPIGQGINKPAVITLLNIKCINKKTGEWYSDGPKADKYREMLIKAARDQGAEFISYDPVEGEWKFKVQHFS